MPSFDQFIDTKLPPDYAHHVHAGNNFYEIKHNDFKASESGDGWKFHLSIHPGDLDQAWEIVSHLVMENGVGSAKVIGDHMAQEFSDPSSGQGGKQITIVGAGKQDWADQMRDIELALRAANIRPSVTPIAGDRMIPGSQYIGYRNDKVSPELKAQRDPVWSARYPDRYIAADEIKDNLIPRGVVAPGMAHNPSGYPDTLQNIDFSKDPTFQETQAALPDWDIKKTIADKSKWHQAVLENGQPTIRLAAVGMSADHLKRVQQGLYDAGIKTEWHHSNTLGPVLRMKGKDVFTFENMQATAIRQLKTLGAINDATWVPVTDRNGKSALYADFDGMPARDRARLQFSLASQGIPYETRVSSFNGGKRVIAVAGTGRDALRALPQAPAMGNTFKAAL